jgi:type I restriction enzyme M protein
MVISNPIQCIPIEHYDIWFYQFVFSFSVSAKAEENNSNFELFDDVLFINASEHFEKGKRQNRLRDGKNGEPNDIEKIIDTYQYRKEEARYSMRVPMERIEKEGYNLNISRYISTAVADELVDLESVNSELLSTEDKIAKAKNMHNQFLRELGLPEIP